MESFSKLRTRLTILYTTVLAALSVLTATLLYSAIFFQSERSNTENLRINAVQLASAYELSIRDKQDNSNYQTVSSSLLDNETSYQIFNDKFDVVEESEAMPINYDESFYLIQKFFKTGSDKGDITNLTLADSFMICTYGYVTSTGELIVVQLARNLSSQRENLRIYFLIVVLIILLGIIVSILLGNFLAKRALYPIKRSYEQQRNFLADASHELRTPVAVVLANLEAVLANKDKTIASQEEWIDNAYTEIKRTKSLVEDLLFLAKADAGERIGSFEPIDLSYLILEISESLNSLAVKKGVNLITNISDIELFTLGDKKRITELFTILIDNALKYTDSGGDVTIDVNATDYEITVSISDTGIGIAKEEQEKIFDRFYRVDKARSRRESGTGLGLAIAKLIIEDHKIALKLDSEEGVGTTFILSFKRYNSVEE